MTDIQGARLTSVQSIGHANEPGKRERPTAAGAGAIIHSLADLALLRARAIEPELLRSSMGSKHTEHAVSADRTPTLAR